MKNDSESRHGRWAFRNQRWYYVPAVDELPHVSHAEMDSDHLSGLVDPLALLRPARDLSQLSGVPGFLFFMDSLADRSQVIGRQELLHSPWSQTIEKECPRLFKTMEQQAREFSKQVLKEQVPVEVESIFGPDTLRGEPIALFTSSSSLFFAVVVSVLVSAEQKDKVRALLNSSGVSQNVAQEVTTQLPQRDKVRNHMRLAAMNASGFSSRLQQAYDHRLELNIEQSKSRQYLIRAESLENQLLRQKAGAEDEKKLVGLESRAVDVLLNARLVGITIEDKDHTIRYLNPYMRKVLGDTVGKKCYRVMKHRNSPCDDCPIDKIWKEGEPSHRYFTTNPDGKENFEVFAMPLVGSRGERLVLELGLNVTNMVHRVEKLERRNSYLKTRNQQLNSLIRGMTLSSLNVGNELSSAVQRIRSSSNSLAQSLDNEELWRWAEAIGTWVQQIEENLYWTEQIAHALGSSREFAPVDLEHELSALADALCNKFDVDRKDVSVATMPTVNVDIEVLRRLVEFLFRNIFHRSRSNAPIHAEIRYARSSGPETTARGDAYHLLVFQLTARHPDGQEGQVQDSEFISPAIHLLATYMGGSAWLEEGGSGNKLYISMPIHSGD